MIKKYILTNNVIECYEYSNYFTGRGGSRVCTSEENKQKNYENHCVRRLNNIRRLATANFSNKDLFLTLTFDDSKVDHDIKNVKACNKVFKNFIKRLKRYLGFDIKYLAVIEFQDLNGRGAVHYHVLLNIEFIEFKKLEELWGLGFIYLNSITHVDNVGAYLIKYICKDGGDSRLMGLPAYLHSRNIEMPKTYIFNNDQLSEEFENKLNIKKFDFLAYNCHYDTELFGEVNYKQYNLSRFKGDFKND